MKSPAVMPQLFQPRNTAPFSGAHRRHFGRWALLLCAVAAAAPLVACAKRSSSDGEAESPDSPARLSFGVSPAEALEGRASSFVLEGTPDLALHATLRDSAYEGKTLQIRGTDPQGAVVWSYPHVQKGASFDAVLPVFGSAAARKHVVGTYSFQVSAPGGGVVAAGTATLVSARGQKDSGAALYRVTPPSDAVLARSKE